MVRLSDEDRERLSLVTDVTHDDCYETTEPGTCALEEVVEQIVARHVAAALNAAADRLDEVARTPRMWMAYPETSRIVRAAANP